MATEKLTEQEIQLRKRARRRLVGAIALVLLMITVLPMVLDDREAQTPQPEIAVSIPSQDRGDFASRVVPVAPPAAPSAPAVTQPEKAPAEVAKPAEAAKPAEPASAAKPEATPPAPPQSEKPVSQVQSGKSMAGAGYSVQLGVFSDAANVKRVQEKLASLNYPSYTEKMTTPTGSKIKLRAGPFADKSAAENAQKALQAAGLAGIVVFK